MKRRELKINKRIRATVSRMLEHETLDDNYVNDEIHALLQDPLVGKHCTEVYIRKCLKKHSIFTAKKNNEKNY